MLLPWVLNQVASAARPRATLIQNKAA